MMPHRPIHFACVTRTALLLVGLLSSLATSAQRDVYYSYPDSFRLIERHDEITLLMGYQQGRHGYAELGIGRNIWGTNMHPYDLAYYAGVEARVDKPELMGVKVGAYVDGGFAMGVQVIQYMHDGKGCTVCRPEIGIGIWKAKVTYAYNIDLSPERSDGTNTHMVSIAYALRLVTLTRRDDRVRNGP